MAEKKCYKLKWRQTFIEKNIFAKVLLNLDKENGKKSKGELYMKNE